MGSNGMRVAILFHARERHFDPAGYLVHHLAELWRQDGLEVVYLYGTHRFVPADLVLVHVGLSVVPEPYLEFGARYPIVLNGRIRDIRKTVTSRYLVRPGDDWDGPVIVKSDLNNGGYPEYLSSLTGLRRMRLVRALARRLGGVPTWRDYRVFERLADVPAPLLERPDLVVERFLPAVEDGLYHLHMYQFLGDRERCARLSSREPVLKADASEMACSVEPHPAAQAWREELGLDYGKIDYIVRDEEVILLDANKTTGSVTTYLEARELRAVRRRQADGIHAYFAGLQPL
jgi:hypothetical protein